ncbi:MAG: aconitate hydratase, partial [Firmicutes bacterium]|nr:aconitate hydratase [Bacillota bacterium]
LTFVDPTDYDKLSLGDRLVIEEATAQVLGGPTIAVKNLNTGETYLTESNFSDLEMKMILAGGKINYLMQN